MMSHPSCPLSTLYIIFIYLNLYTFINTIGGKLQKKVYKIMRQDENGKYYYDEFSSLNEARAEMVRLSKAGILDGGIIFKPTGFGTVIKNEHYNLPENTYLYSGPRAYFLPILEDGSVMPRKEFFRGVY